MRSLISVVLEESHAFQITFELPSVRPHERDGQTRDRPSFVRKSTKGDVKQGGETNAEGSGQKRATETRSVDPP